MTSPSPLLTPRTRPIAYRAIALFLVVALAVTGLTALQARPAHAAQLATNYHFGSGTTGWQAKGSAASLQPITISGGKAVRLTTSTTQIAVLDDVRATVADAGAPGAGYDVKARVRSNTAGVTGSLRVTEVTSAGSTNHQSAFTTKAGSWQMVYLQVTTTRSNPALSVNVVANSLRPGQTLDIDLVSVEGSTATAAPRDACQDQVSRDTLFGSHMTTSGISAEDSLARLDAAFGRIPVVRVFDPGMPMEWSHQRNEVLKGRTMVLSFRPMPQDILSGKHDAFFRRWFATAPEDRTIYWSYIHEPEPLIKAGRFTASQYRAAWQRLDGLADEACKPNMFSTLILTGWTAEPASGRDYRTYDAGKDVVDVLAWDPYNGATDKDRDYYESIDSFLAPAVRISVADGRPWGIAETGSRLVPGDDGRGRAAWLKAVGDYVIANNGSFVAYFQSTRDGDWRLNDPYSRKVWSDFVAR